MKKISKRETVWMSKPETVEIQYFVTSDGREFKNEERAVKHQMLLNIESVYLDNELPEHVTFHNIKSLDEVRLLTDKYFMEENKEYLETLPLPAWVGIEAYFDHDCDSYNLHKIEDLKQSMSKTFESFNNLLSVVNNESM